MQFFKSVLSSALVLDSVRISRFQFRIQYMEQFVYCFLSRFRVHYSFYIPGFYAYDRLTHLKGKGYFGKRPVLSSHSNYTICSAGDYYISSNPQSCSYRHQNVFIRPTLIIIRQYTYCEAVCVYGSPGCSFHYAAQSAAHEDSALFSNEFSCFLGFPEQVCIRFSAADYCNYRCTRIP